MSSSRTVGPPFTIPGFAEGGKGEEKWTATMSENSKVETVSRLARWKIENFGNITSRRSDSFRVGAWKWYLYVDKTSGYSSYGSLHYSHPRIMLYLEDCLCSDNKTPQARFLFRASSNSSQGQQPHVSPVNERLFKKGESFTWGIHAEILGRLIIEVEFMDLKKSTSNPCFQGEGASNTLLPEDWMKSMIQKSSHSRLSRMLQENILTDITIKVSGGTLHAHKVVLVASSPVFQSMFAHDLREKESSTIEIEDMSQESCRALLDYLYGVIKEDDLWVHRHVLLSAADKYDIVDLKQCCEESLVEDITIDNVLERLHDSWHYQLHLLKKRCLSFLFDFGKINDIKDQISSFLCQVEQALVAEMFQEMLAMWSQA